MVHICGVAALCYVYVVGVLSARRFRHRNVILERSADSTDRDYIISRKCPIVLI